MLLHLRPAALIAVCGSVVLIAVGGSVVLIAVCGSVVLIAVCGSVVVGLIIRSTITCHAISANGLQSSMQATILRKRCLTDVNVLHD